jgi:DNA repair protein RadC
MSLADRPAVPSLSSAANRLRATACHERPQERMEKMGPAAMGDAELLALLLRSGTRGQDVLTLAARLIAEAGSLCALTAWRPGDFRRFKGIGPVKALQLVAVLEVARRAMGRAASEAPLLTQADLVAAFLHSEAAGLEVEKVWVLCLNRKNRLLKNVEVSSGTATTALVHPREVFRAAIRESAAAVIVAHNHPSGDPSPSNADTQVTRMLRDASKAVEIVFLDHVIVGRAGADPQGKGYYSFREAGLI